MPRCRYLPWANRNDSRMDGLTVKGLKGGVLIGLPPVPWYQQRDLIISRIQTQERFFKGGRIALDVGTTDWTEEQLVGLLRLLSDEGVCLWAVLSTSPLTLAAALAYDVPTTLLSQTPAVSPESQQPVTTGWIERDLQPDEKLVLAGDVVILGGVPTSCEVLAEGSLLVWGLAEGVLRAGCGGSESACLLLLNYRGARVFLQGEEVAIPRKAVRQGPIEVRRQGGKPQAHLLKTEKKLGLR